MAEGILKAMLPMNFRDTISVNSAGTAGIPGSGATENAIMAATECAADISEHISRPVTEELLRESNLVLCMASNHREFLDTRFPAFHDNYFLLKDFASPMKAHNPDIFDPIGGDLAKYRECCQIIATEIARILPTVQQFASTTYL